MDKYKCRTCLGIISKETSTQITDECVDKNIKQSIIQIVPEMESTLMDDEVICSTCLKILRSCIRFINRCLRIETEIQENITKQLEAFTNVDYSTNPLKGNISLDHDYLETNEYMIINDSTSDESDVDISEFNNLLDVLPVEDDVDIQEEHSFHSEESEDTTQDEIIQEDKIVDINENCEQDSSICFECDICKETFTDIDSLTKHEDTHNLICQICSESFENKHDYAFHKIIHPPFMCDKCGKTFMAESFYKRHERVHQDRDCMCEVCGKMFPSNSSLEYHQNSHVEERMFMCDKCPRKYKSHFNLKRHLQLTHERREQHQCQKCGIVVLGRQTYAKHYRLVHLQLKPFVCDVCGREFGRKDYLQKHMYYHTGEPRPIQHRNKIKSKTSRRGKPPKFGIRLKDPGTPVNCKICGKLILSVHLLKSHLQSHVKIKRHKCSYCELTFTLSNNRDRHQRIHESDPERKFRCNICWKKMKTAEELEHHIVGHYNRPPQHSCDICGEKFHRKYLLDNHHLHKHTDPGDIEKAEKEIVIKNLLEYAHPNDIYDKIKCE